jgi:hypothetical protein
MDTDWVALSGIITCCKASFPFFSRWTFDIALMNLLASVRGYHTHIYISICQPDTELQRDSMGERLLIKPHSLVSARPHTILQYDW